MSKIKELLKWRADRYNKMLERRKQNREKSEDERMETAKRKAKQ